MSDNKDNKCSNKDGKCTASNTALLVLNYQQALYEKLKKPEATLNNTIKVINECRKQGIPIVYSVLQFRPQFHSIADSNKVFAEIKKNKLFITQENPVMAELQVDVANEPVIVTRRLSAFFNSELMSILNAKNIKHLIVVGLSTSQFVLSTVRSASDADYVITVVEDCCADTDADVHKMLMKVFENQACVTTTEKILSSCAQKN